MSWFDEQETGPGEHPPAAADSHGNSDTASGGESAHDGDGPTDRAASWGVAPGPGLWPWGRRARARRARRDQAQAALSERARRLREAGAGDPTEEPPILTRPWRRVPARQNLRVIASLVAVVAVVVGLGWWMSTTGTSPSAGASGTDRVGGGGLPTPTTDTSLYTSAGSPEPTSSVRPSSGLVTPRPAIPSAGVTPMSPPSPSPVDPASVDVVEPPSHPAGPDDLASPESAMAAFLSRWCPYTYTAQFGARERLASSAMTRRAYAQIEPASNDSGRRTWQQVVVPQQQTARCSRPQVQISPEAPRSPDQVIVIGQIRQVTTTGSGKAWVETLTQTRIVLRGDDGLWRVGRISRGG